MTTLRASPVALALLSALFSTPVRADAPHREEATWSFGAGVGTRESSGMLALTPGLGSLEGVRAWVPQVSLHAERRLGKSLWLGFSAAGQHWSSGDERGTATSSSGATVGLQVRAVVARRGPVELSLFGGGAFGAGWAARTVADAGSTSLRPASSDAMLASLGAGLALETELADALALRLSSGLLSATWSRTESLVEATPTEAPETTKGTSRTIGLQFTPAIELRWYF